jgi:hypothetical protein
MRRVGVLVTVSVLGLAGCGGGAEGCGGGTCPFAPTYAVAVVGTVTRGGVAAAGVPVVARLFEAPCPAEGAPPADEASGASDAGGAYAIALVAARPTGGQCVTLAAAGTGAPAEQVAAALPARPLHDAFGGPPRDTVRVDLPLP